MNSSRVEGLKNFRTNIRELRLQYHSLSSQFKIRKSTLFLPMALSLIASFADGLNVALMVPALTGITNPGFGTNSSVHLRSFISSHLQRLGLTVQVETEFQAFLILIVAMIGAAGFKFAFLYSSSVLFRFSLRHISNQLRKQIFSRYLKFGRTYFDEQNGGYLQQILTHYTELTVNSFQSLNNILTNFFNVFIYFGMMLYLSWKMSLVIIMLLPILHLSIRKLIQQVKGYSTEIESSHKSLSMRVSNTLSCLPLIKSQSMENSEIKCFEVTSDRLEKVGRSSDKQACLVPVLQEGMITLYLAIVLVVSAVLMKLYPDKPFAEYLVFIYLMRRLGTAIASVGNIQVITSTARGYMDRIAGVFDDTGKAVEREGTFPHPPFHRAIELKGLNFSYRQGMPILKNVSLTIPHSKVTAIVGASGSGKSTLTHLLLRFYDFSDGTILFDGVDIRLGTLQSLRSQFAVVAQENYILDGTLKENITYGIPRILSEEEIWKVLKGVGLAHWAQSMPRGLDTEIGEKGVKVSGGEKQRIALARAFLKDAPILILDEATSALDSETEAIVQAALKHFRGNKTSLVIAHRLSTIQHADQIVVLHHGIVVDSGSFDELMGRCAAFKSLWQKQVGAVNQAA